MLVHYRLAAAVEESSICSIVASNENYVEEKRRESWLAIVFWAL